MKIVRHVVFAHPCQLDRRLYLHGDGGRLADEIIGAAAAEPATHPCLVDDDFVLGKVQQGRDLGQSARGGLGGRPDFHRSIMKPGRGVHRFQCDMAEEGVFIESVNGLCGLAEGPIHIAHIGDDVIPRSFGQVPRHRGCLGGIVFRSLAFVPIDLERLLGVEGAPGRGCNHGDARHDFLLAAIAVQDKGVLHARQGLDLVQIGA